MVPGYRTCGACHAQIAAGLTPAGVGLTILFLPMLVVSLALAIGLPVLGLILDAGMFWLWFRLMKRHGWCARTYSRVQMDAAYRRLGPR